MIQDNKEFIQLEHSVLFPAIVLLNDSRYIKCMKAYFFCVSPTLMRILWTSTLEVADSPYHHDDTIWRSEDADQLVESSHLNLSISRSPMSFSVTRRKECVLLAAIFSILRGKRSHEIFIATLSDKAV